MSKCNKCSVFKVTQNILQMLSIQNFFINIWFNIFPKNTQIILQNNVLAMINMISIQTVSELFCILIYNDCNLKYLSRIIKYNVAVKRKYFQSREIKSSWNDMSLHSDLKCLRTRETASCSILSLVINCRSSVFCWVVK